MKRREDDFIIKWSGRSHDFEPEDIDYIVEVVKNMDPMTQGKHLSLFQSKLAKYLGAKQGSIFAVNSGTSALELSAALTHIKRGDEVIVPGHTFCASALPFLRRGARLIWADINPETWVLDIEDVKAKFSPRTKAIVVVHLYGLPADMDEFLKLSKTFIIEDAAQAFGAKYKGRSVGILGDMGIYSFHAQKNLTTFGEGGALYVRDKRLAQKVAPLRSFGNMQFRNKRYYWSPAVVNVESVIDWELPYKLTISEIQCAIGHRLIDKISVVNGKRGERYWKFRNSFKNFPELKFQHIPDYAESSYHLLPAKYEGRKHGIKADRNNLMELLAFKYKIQVVVQYYPLYRYSLFKKWGFGKANCKNVDNFFDNMISFPFHVWMSEDKFDYMIESTKRALTELRK